MRVKMSIEDVLQGKSKDGVVTVEETTLMQEAIRLMADNNFGALVITSQGKPVGIVTERDVLRQAAAYNECSLRKPVSEVMTRDLVVACLGDDIEVVKRVMTEKRFRHMPVMHQGTLVGMVSIGDLVRAQLTTVQAEAIYLKDYIRGEYT